jgi:hypothetical protein
MEVKMARGNPKKTALGTGGSKAAKQVLPRRPGALMTTDLAPQRGGRKVQTKSKSGSKRGR